MRFSILNLLVLIVIIVGAISTSKMNIFWLIGEIVLWSLIHLILLKKDWKYLYKIFRKGFIVFFIFLVFLVSFAIFNMTSFLISLIRFLCIGIISVLFLVPVVTDSLLISTQKIPLLGPFFEAFVLIRNFISSLTDDLFLGILTAPKFKESNLFAKVKFIGLATFTLIARTPEIATSLLSSSKISKFDTTQLKKITKPTKGLYISIGLALLYFTFYLIQSYGEH